MTERSQHVWIRLPEWWSRLTAGTDAFSLLVVLGGLLLLYVPTYWDFLFGLWAPDTEGHEPLILAVCLWLALRKREALQKLPSSGAAPRSAAVMLTIGLIFYIFGRSQQWMRFELASQLFVFSAVLLSFKGWAGVRTIWFALFFLCFLIPLPRTVVLAITGPMKMGVSAVATTGLAALGYPIGRSGVVITIGQYQLLVADACAGLQTMFTLEALGLLYANLMAYQSAVRSALLAILVVPVSFCANIVRVMILVLVTYHFGDEAGQGFVHGFAGLVLFAVALTFIMSVDRLIGMALPPRWAR